MIFFGHVGPTTALVKFIDSKITKGKYDINATHIDYRMVLIGSDLPDIIDKPIGVLIFRGVFHNSRIFCHTLLFSMILILLGCFRANKTKNIKNNIIILGICSLVHQLLDSMWLYREIFYWPLLGLKFPVRTEGNWAAEGLARLLTDPTYYIPEILGIIIMFYYFIKLLKQKKIKNFLFTGKL